MNTVTPEILAADIHEGETYTCLNGKTARIELNTAIADPDYPFVGIIRDPGFEKVDQIEVLYTRRGQCQDTETFRAFALKEVASAK